MAAKKKTAATGEGREARRRDRDRRTRSIEDRKLARGRLASREQGLRTRRSTFACARSRTSRSTRRDASSSSATRRSRASSSTSRWRANSCRRCWSRTSCKTLIDEGKTISIRQMYYMSKHTVAGHEREHVRGAERERSDHRGSRGRRRRASRGAAPLRRAQGLDGRQARHRTTRAIASTSRAWAPAAGASRASASRTSSKFVREQGRVHPLRREGSDVQPLQRGQILAQAQLHLDDERADRPRAARDVFSSACRPSSRSRSTCSSTTIRGVSTSTRSSSRARSTSRTSRCASPCPACASSA